MRKHGLQWPLDMHQVGSWIIFTFLVSGVYIFYIPFVDSLPTRFALLAVYSLLVLTVIALGFATSSSDPSDPALSTGSCDGEYFCTICQASVGGSSKHCRSCDRCVEGFDHHCKWLNNCIGSSNYRAFFALLVTTITMVTMQLGWGLWLLARSIYDAETMTELVAAKYSYLQYHGWQAVLVLYLLLIAVSLLTLGELLVFHIVLIYKNMTTYDYIMAQRQLREGEPMSPRTAAASSSGNVGARAALCRSNRVVDTSLAVVLPKRKALKVGLNPCAACKTEKLPGSVREWEKGGGKVVGGMQMPPDPEKLVRPESSRFTRETLASSFSAACSSSDPGAAFDKPLAAVCSAGDGARVEQPVEVGLGAQGGRGRDRDPLSLVYDSGVDIACSDKAGAAAGPPKSASLGGEQVPSGGLAARQPPPRKKSNLGVQPVPLPRKSDLPAAQAGKEGLQGQPQAAGQAPTAQEGQDALQLPPALPQRRLLAPLPPLPDAPRAAAAIPPSPTVANSAKAEAASEAGGAGQQEVPAPPAAPA